MTARPSCVRSRSARKPVGLLLALVLLLGGLGATGVAPAVAAEDDPAAPSALTVNGIAKPVDLDQTPRFGWHVGTARQSAYEIVVASTAAGAADHEGDVWSSGKVASTRQNVVAYDGPALAKQERYFWTVRTWDADGRASAWSKVGTFGTGPGETWSDSSPIWAPTTFTNWGDFTLDTDFTVVQNAAAITFRTTSTSAFYLWQIRSDTNTLKTHFGTTLIDETPLAEKGLTIKNGETHHLRIEADGATVRTWIDDVLVRSGSTHSTYLTGGFGFRTGSTEQATFDNLVVKDLTGKTLYSNTFDSGAVPEMPTLSVSGGKLVVAASKNDYVPGSWSNYTVSSKVKVTEVATGLAFRATDASNSYMWQLRAADNQLKTHRQVSGTYTALKTVNLPAGTLAVGKEVTVRIEAIGTTIKTWIDNVLVDTTTDTTFRRGAVGFRNGLTEAAEFSDFSVKDANAAGGSIIATSFAPGDDTFACGSAAGGILTVGKGEVCLLAGLTSSWAFLRHDVDVKDKDVAWASVYATASNPKTAKQYVYKLYLNGEFVGLGPTQPVAGETRYDGFDVTDLVRKGRSNAIGALAYTTNDQKLQAQMVVEYTDGTRDVFGTDSTWKARSGDSVFPAAGSIGTSYFVAPKENLDARKYPWGFDETGYDDSSWRAAVMKSALPTLTATPTDKVQEQLRAPVKIVDKGNGNYFVDFGRTWIGGVSYDIANGTEGAKVDLRFGEVTSAENTVKYALNTTNTYQDVPTLKAGKQTIDTWGARVFRYVEIVGAPEPVTKDNLKALALVYPFDEAASTFTASNDNLEQVYGLSKNSIESLNLNFYTDSWTRERTNYEADAYLQQMSSLYLMDDLSLGRYSMNYFKGNRTWPTEWPIYVILAVHDAWQQTGDTVELAAYYDNLKTKLPSKWLESSTGLIRKDTGVGCSSQTDCDIVDWPTSERDGYVFQPYNTVVNAISYRAYRDMAAIATELGRTDEATTYTAIADRMRTAMEDAFYDADKGQYRDGMSADKVKSTHYSVHANAFTLAFGVPTEAQQAPVAAAIKARGMACSVYCAAFLVKALYDGGDGQTALDMLTGTGTRSWMNMIKLGAGSTAEAWDPSLKSNLTYSHPWAASPAFNVPSGLFGIQPLTPGYETFQVKPQPGDLATSSITVPTVRGTIAAAFEHDESGAMALEVTVPGNSVATVQVPIATGAEADYVPSHARTATYGGRTTISGNVYATFTVGQGSWTFGPGDQPTGTVSAAVSGQAQAGWLGPNALLTLTTTGRGVTTEHQLGDGPWTAYSAPVELVDGTYVVGYRVRDGEDVLDQGTLDVKVDGSAPTLQQTTSGRAVTLVATDAGSGLASTEYRLDDGDWTVYAAPVEVDDDAHVVAFRATDVAGNVSAPGTVDLAAVYNGAQVSASVSHGGADGWYGRGAALSLTAGDGARIAKLEYALGDGAWTTWTDDVELVAGTQTISYRATAQNGAVSPTGSLEVKVDLTTPTVTAQQTGRTLTLTGVDGDSGVAAVEYRLDDGDWIAYTGPVTVDGEAHVIGYRVTDVAGNRSETASATFEQAPTGPAPAPVVTVPPAIGGAVRLGSTLTATSGTWDQPGSTFGYQWLRDGQVVAGATARTYRVSAADIGRRLVVQVTASLRGHADGVAQSARTTAVPKVSSSTRLTVKDRSIRSGQRLRTTVRVTSAAGMPSGRVVVTYRGRVTRVLTLRNGVATATFRPEVKGRHTLTFTYQGSGVATGSKDSAKIRIR